jgi:hypothetical protein
MENDSGKKPLSNIPFGILQSMQKQTAITDEDLERLQQKVRVHGPALHAHPESIKPIIPKDEQLPGTIVTPVPTMLQKPAIMSYAIEGHVIQVPLDSVGAGIQLFYTLLAFVWGQDKKIAKILKQFDFKFLDANNVQIYPPLKKNAKK